MRDDSNCRLIRRASGGWLALSGPNRPFRIGVTAPTPEEAGEALAEAEKAWDKNLASDDAPRSC